MSYTDDELKSIIIEKTEEGMITPAKICRTLEIPLARFYKLVDDDPKLKERLVNARERGMEIMVDRLLEVPESEMDVARASLLSNNIKWIASKRAPKIYGDKVDINVNQTVDIQFALDEAKKRVGTTREVFEIKDHLENNQTDTKSVQDKTTTNTNPIDPSEKS